MIKNSILMTLSMALLSVLALAASACSSADPCETHVDRSISCGAPAAQRDLGIALCRQVGFMDEAACASCRNGSTCEQLNAGACSTACQLNPVGSPLTGI